MEKLPNELLDEILKTRTQEPSFDLVENSALMDKVLLKYSLSPVSKGMKKIASLFLGHTNLKTKISANQWAVFFARRGYISYLKELEAKTKFECNIGIYWVAVEAKQSQITAYLETKIDVKVPSNWSLKDLSLVMKETSEPKWKCFEALCRYGDVVNAILYLSVL